ITPDRVATKAAADLLAQLRNDYEYVIIAAPPTLSTFTASAVSEYADAVLLLASLGTTRRRDLIRAVQSLEATGAPLSGVVLVGEDGQRPEPDLHNRTQVQQPPLMKQSAKLPTPLSGMTFEDQESLSSARQRGES